MAVKKHKLFHHNQTLEILAEYLRNMNNDPNYLPTPNELVKTVKDIIKRLSRAQGTEQELWPLIQSVEEFLVRVMTKVHHTTRCEIMHAVSEQLNILISDRQFNPSPATSIMVIVYGSNNDEARLIQTRRLVKKMEDDTTGESLWTSLSRLYSWMCQWRSTPTLGDWVMSYIEALEENEKFDLLIDVSIANLNNLFQIMNDPGGLRENYVNVIFHILASLRESTDALDKISPSVRSVLMTLAAESGQWSRNLLQTLVDILTSMVFGIRDSLEGEAQDNFKEKYLDVISCLEQHMASKTPMYTQKAPWRALKVSPRINPLSPALAKIGLINLGNTCYMNSVIQALLVTRHFSSHVLLKMSKVPYWARMGVLFSKLMFSLSSKLDPDEFLSIVKPPFFTKNNQHDSSEFLGYLFMLLQSYENSTSLDSTFDYTQAAADAQQSTMTFQNSTTHETSGQSAQTSSAENAEADSNRRGSISPRPGSSAAEPSSACLKRPAQRDIENPASPPKKRYKITFIENWFGGVLLNRIQCTVCRASSMSRDVFCDLQLAFPEKPEALQHSVQSLLEYYCSKERMSGDNRYNCRECGCPRDAERSVIIENTPRYLILVLKNFKFEHKAQKKLMLSIHHNHMVTLPNVRSPTEHSAYSLYAAIIHVGTSLDSGHYYTWGKDNGRWHVYNDDLVSSADETHLTTLSRSSTPYILFYRRTDIEECAAPTLAELPDNLQETIAAHNKYYIDTVHQLQRQRQ